MLIPAKYASVGIKRSFSKRHKFLRVIDSAPSGSDDLRLSNSKVEFIFGRNSVSGAVLKSWRRLPDGVTFYNNSTFLWYIGCIRTPVHGDPKIIQPSESTFDNTTFTVNSISGGQQIQFIWRDLLLDPSINYKFDLLYTITLMDGDDFADFSFELRSTSSPTGGKVALSTVCFINLALSSIANNGDDEVFMNGYKLGQTIRDPIRHLASLKHKANSWSIDPANAEETIYESHDAQPAVPSPFGSFVRAIHSHPGLMAIPLMSLADRKLQEGTMIYALDPDGLNAKVFSWWSDKSRMCIAIQDQADSEFDFYGVGGHWNGWGNYNSQYKINWSVQIRPYKSPTKWAEHYAAVLYRKDVVPKLNYIPEPLWKRADNGEIKPEVANAPFVASTFQGIYSANEYLNGTASIREIYERETGQTNFGFWNHFHTFAFEGTGQGWESYNTGGTTQGWPDKLPINSFWNSIFPQVLSITKLPTMVYNLFGLYMGKDSTWPTTYSGWDAALKTKFQENDTYTAHGQGGEGVCFAVPLIEGKSTQIESGMAAGGITSYRDTFGTWSIGCYAKSHVYYDADNNQTVTLDHYHPRGAYSHYFNKRAVDLLSGWAQAVDQNIHNNWASTTTAGIINNCEFTCDRNLPYISVSIESRPFSDQFFGTYDSTYAGIVFGDIVNGYFTHPPEWYEYAPIFETVHGGRYRRHNLVAPHAGNIVDQSGSAEQNAFYNIGFPTGLSGANLTVVHEDYSNNPTKRMEQAIANMAYETIGVGTMLTLAHWDPSGQFTQIKNDQSWTGDSRYSSLYNYVADYMRVVEATKEYTLDGYMLYTFNTWSGGGIGYNPQGFDIRLSVTSKYHQQRSGEYYVLHNVRQHKSGDSLLITITNWGPTAQTYKGLFIPTEYEIDGYYNIYSISYAKGSLGQKTLLRTNQPSVSHVFEEQLQPFSFALYEVTPTSATKTSGSLGMITDRVNIRYSYGKKELTTDSVVIAYSYDSSIFEEVDDPLFGWEAYATQAILNNLPPWMAARNDSNSNAHKLVNSWGMAVQELSEAATKGLRDLFPTLVDLKTRFRLFKSTVLQADRLTTTPDKNLLYNSDFVIKDVARLNLPAGWISKNAELVDTESIDGIYSIRLKGASYIKQTVEISTEASAYTASVFAKNTGSATGYLLLQAQYIDDTLESVSTPLILSSVWRKTALTINLKKRPVKITLSIVGDFLSTSSDVIYIDTVQLERGTRATSWEPSVFDTPPYLGGSLPFRRGEAITPSGKITLFSISDENEFLDILIPTRVEFQTPNYDLLPMSTPVYGKKITALDDIYDVKWTVKDGKIAEVNKDNESDVFGKYTIRDLRIYFNAKYGTLNDPTVTITPQAATVVGDLLYVVCQEVYEGNTIYTLKVCRPRTPPNNKTYIESLADFKLEGNLGLDFGEGKETVTSIGVSSVDPNWLIVNTSKDRRLYYRLYYDYYTVDPETRAIYTLEDYGQAAIKVI